MLPSALHKIANFPGSHSQDSVEVNLPPGPNALGFTSASETHFPTK
jgi:hypothetical protein